jgi:hypothetical protein
LVLQYGFDIGFDGQVLVFGIGWICFSFDLGLEILSKKWF